MYNPLSNWYEPVNLRAYCLNIHTVFSSWNRIGGIVLKLLVGNKLYFINCSPQCFCANEIILLLARPTHAQDTRRLRLLHSGPAFTRKFLRGMPNLHQRYLGVGAKEPCSIHISLSAFGIWTTALSCFCMYIKKLKLLIKTKIIKI